MALYTLARYSILGVRPSVRQSVRPASCPVHISYNLWGRNSKFGVWMHHGMTEWGVPLSGHCGLDLWPSFYNNRVRSISLILFEVGISNLVCGCILGWRSVAYQNWVTVTLNLTSDLVSRNCIESRTYLLYSVRWEFQIWCVNAFWDGGVSHTIFWSLWPWSWTLT